MCAETRHGDYLLQKLLYFPFLMKSSNKNCNKENANDFITQWSLLTHRAKERKFKDSKREWANPGNI